MMTSSIPSQQGRKLLATEVIAVGGAAEEAMVALFDWTTGTAQQDHGLGLRRK